VEIVAIEARIRDIDPEKYAATRNFKDGAVTHLGPYISRGMISTRQVYEHIASLDLPWYKTEKLIQELAWRDYYQQVWIAKKDGIFHDLKNQQSPVSNNKVPRAVIDACTGIEEIDKAIRHLYATGYMHNHMRMYVASICCNIAQSHWLEPARWLYSHLLDGDLASNHLSWQWVAGAFSNKKYYANQENINTFFHSSQKDTFLDVEYREFDLLGIPGELLDTVEFRCSCALPGTDRPILEKYKKTLIYNYYNIDPSWYKGQDVQRIFLMEPSFFDAYPVHQHCIDFALDLAKNIPGIKVFVGDFSDFEMFVDPEYIVYKEHPTNSHYKGTEESRAWMSSVSGYFPSFFSFWKKCKNELRG